LYQEKVQKLNGTVQPNCADDVPLRNYSLTFTQ